MEQSKDKKLSYFGHVLLKPIPYLEKDIIRGAYLGQRRRGLGSETNHQLRSATAPSCLFQQSRTMTGGIVQSTMVHYLSKSKTKPQLFYASKGKKYFLSKLLKLEVKK